MRHPFIRALANELVLAFMRDRTYLFNVVGRTLWFPRLTLAFAVAILAQALALAPNRRPLTSFLAEPWARAARAKTRAKTNK